MDVKWRITPKDCLVLLLEILTISVAAAQSNHHRILLDDVVILVDSGEPSYIQYAAKDLGNYLTQISGKPVRVSPVAEVGKRAKSIVVVGKTMVQALKMDLPLADDLGSEGSVIRSFDQGGSHVIVIAGLSPHGTNAGIATLLPMISAEGKSAYLEGPLDVRSKPSFPVRGIHLNGWPLKYPYAFRSWKEEDWKRFVDIAWAQRINLLFLWPFMEIIPVPLSAEDEAYLQEVQRVVEYAQKQRGMEVWIMQSANRIAVSDCGSKNPRFRIYWVPRDCQEDMNPADPKQFDNILAHFEALYKIVDNADGFTFIDSDPGGWPGSPLSDQTKIFNGARKLLDRYSIHREKTKLIDWMWLGWGRHPTGEESGKQAVALMQETIRNFKANLVEPWELISGMSPYLESAKNESVLGKTIYLHYGAIEEEPAFPATNLGLESMQEVFDTASRYPEIKGIMGNNELMSLQFPRTFYFFNRAWNEEYKTRQQPEMLLDLAEQLYPDHKQLVADSFQKLRESDPDKIDPILAELAKIIQTGDAGRPGAIGHYLFPDRLTVIHNLQQQLEIRLARQRFIKAMQGKPNIAESAQLLETYFDKLLSWNQETGWSKMIDITIWRTPIYENGKDLSNAMTELKQVIAHGNSYTSYTQTHEFFDGISNRLLKKYGRDSVMIGCVDPFELALIQGW